MIEAKFKNKTVNFSSKEDLLQYISKNWNIQHYQIILDEKHINQLKYAFLSIIMLNYRQY